MKRFRVVPATLVSLGFIVGIGLGSWGAVSVSPSLLLLACGLVAYGVFRHRVVRTGLCLLGVVIGGMVYASYERHRVDDLPQFETPVSGDMRIVQVPKRKELFQEIVARFDRCEGACPDAAIVIRAPLGEEYHYGDRVQGSVMLQRVETFSEDFDYRMYLWKEGVGYLGTHLQQRVHVSSPWSQLFGVAEAFEHSVATHIPEPEASLGVGLILGGDERFPNDMRATFRLAGLSHLVALSGFNIAMISLAVLLVSVVMGLTRKQAAVVALGASGLLVLVAGLPPSGIRALGMAFALFVSLMLGRRYGALQALFAACAAMLLINPLLLRYDIGFQLSVLATLGIILAMPLWQYCEDRIRFGGFFLQAVFFTLSAELFLLPVVFATFHQFSLVAFPANILLASFIPFATLLVFLVGLMGMVSGWLGAVFAFPAYVLLHLITWGARFFAQVPLQRLTVDVFGWGWFCIWYGTLAAGLGWFWWATRGRLMRDQ